VMSSEPTVKTARPALQVWQEAASFPPSPQFASCEAGGVVRRPVVAMTEPGCCDVAKAGQANSLPETDRGFRCYLRTRARSGPTLLAN
jgi:hypothetical protein